MTHPSATPHSPFLPDAEPTLASLLRDVETAADAFVRGDMATYLTHIRHAPDYTLFRPDGGDAVHGFHATPEQIEQMSRTFRDGESTLEIAASYTSHAGDLAVIVLIERQHGQIGPLPDQDFSLRVTLVFRRDPSGWLLLHRHADPLVRPITMDQLASLTRV